MMHGAVGSRSCRLSRGNLCVTDIPTATSPKHHALKTDRQFAKVTFSHQEMCIVEHDAIYSYLHKTQYMLNVSLCIEILGLSTF